MRHFTTDHIISFHFSFWNWKQFVCDFYSFLFLNWSKCLQVAEAVHMKHFPTDHIFFFCVFFSFFKIWISLFVIFILFFFWTGASVSRWLRQCIIWSISPPTTSAPHPSIPARNCDCVTPPQKCFLHAILPFWNINPLYSACQDLMQNLHIKVSGPRA